MALSTIAVAAMFTIWVLAATQCPNARLSVKFDETDLIYHSLYGRISSTDLPGWSRQSGLFFASGNRDAVATANTAI